MKCPKCKHEIAFSADTCPNCGGKNPYLALAAIATIAVVVIYFRYFH